MGEWERDEWASFADSHLNLQKAINKIGDDSRARMKQQDIEDQIKTLEAKKNEAYEEIGDLREEIKGLRKELNESNQELNQYKTLLSKPFQEIAKVNGDFKAAYEKQQDLLADWILSQEAFKETAIQFGIELGKSIDDVKQVVIENEMAVLENRTEHNNNADKYPTLADRREKFLHAKKSNK